jgi:hypothetical protein
MAILISQIIPKNAAVGWDQSCDFWRYNGSTRSVCPLPLIIKGQLYAGGARVTVSASGGWLATQSGGGCAGSDSYVSGTSALSIDVWKALADGVWSSSVAFSIWCSTVSFPSGGSVTVETRCGPGERYASSGEVPTDTQKDVLVIRNEACPTSNVATLTVYDDGTFTYS